MRLQARSRPLWGRASLAKMLEPLGHFEQGVELPGLNLLKVLGALQGQMEENRPVSW